MTCTGTFTFTERSLKCVDSGSSVYRDLELFWHSLNLRWLGIGPTPSTSYLLKVTHYQTFRIAQYSSFIFIFHKYGVNPISTEYAIRSIVIMKCDSYTFSQDEIRKNTAKSDNLCQADMAQLFAW